ncbi:FUSC family protein [Ramlibacter sp. USB13]|uniref:FUSC family protein n=1 Tax=Ramlibacter cellulosilyticus TaxID=2764187 RepID=A0A923MUY7_9BURK|nr:FUSC family protein [Ramlibacter cellulosilyticus]MBC5784222.1 FUSC family protein [Ramlibacter cellulosilyticus]
MNRLREFLARELRELARINASNRPWEMPLAAAAATALPVLIGAAFGELAHGLAASLGGLVFLHLPGTVLSHRMAWLMACAFGLISSYALGVLSNVYEPLTIPVLAVIAAVVTMVCRFYAVPPPGSLFFVMAAAIGAYTPASGAATVLQVGLVSLGCVLAVGIAFLYSLYLLRRQAPGAAPKAVHDFDVVVTEPVLIGAFVGLSLALAQALQLPRPYWVPVSCLAVIQGVTLRAVWTRQVQRIIGTGLGVLLFWGVAALPLNAWTVAVAIFTLSFIIETLVVRHYGMAVVFITPLSILLAEAAHLGSIDAHVLMQARLLDTVLGCVVGLAGGACLHSDAVRGRAGALLRRMVPQRVG